MVDLASSAPSRRFEPVKQFPASTLQALALEGDFLYVAFGGSEIPILNVSDVMNPTDVRAIPLSGVSDLDVYAGYLYALSAGRVYVYDLAEPTLPVQVALISGGGSWLTVSDGSLFVGHNLGLSLGHGLIRMVDISDPTTPTVVNAFETPFPPASVTTSGTLAYVSCRFGGLYLFDLNNGAVIGSYRTPMAVSHVVAGQSAWVATSTGLAVIPLDCADPVPTMVNRFDATRNQSRVHLTWALTEGANLPPVSNDLFRVIARDTRSRRILIEVRQSGRNFEAYDELSNALVDGAIIYNLQWKAGGTWETLAETRLAIDRPALSFSLTGGQPNPFNPTTNIVFSLRRSSHVSLAAFDIQGHRVALIADADYAAGGHSVPWQAVDQRGDSLPSGTYLVRMKVGGDVRTKKLTLVR